MNKYTKFVQSRGPHYEQPYENFPYYIKISILDKEIWVDLSATSEKHFYLEVDKTIANAFLIEGKNSIRESINSLLKPENNYDLDDPLDFNY